MPRVNDGSISRTRDAERRMITLLGLTTNDSSSPSRHQSDTDDHLFSTLD